jgi:uncharacterized protein (TIGR02444 family)
MLSAAEFWAFSCTHYEQQGVKEACLELQNKYQFNVNILLLCCYMQKQSLLVNLALIEQCVTAIASIDEQLNKVRDIRIEVKSIHELAYRHLLKAELSLEKQQQQMLVDTVNQQCVPSTEVKESMKAYAQFLELDNNSAVQSLLNLINRT